MNDGADEVMARTAHGKTPEEELQTIGAARAVMADVSARVAQEVRDGVRRCHVIVMEMADRSQSGVPRLEAVKVRWTKHVDDRQGSEIAARGQ